MHTTLALHLAPHHCLNSPSLVFHDGLNTNNHHESMNRVLKDKYFNGRIDKRLDSLLAEYMRALGDYMLEYVRNQMTSLGYAYKVVSTSTLAGVVCTGGCAGPLCLHKGQGATLHKQVAEPQALCSLCAGQARATS